MHNETDNCSENGNWFPWRHNKERHGILSQILIKMAIGIIIGMVFFLTGRTTFAIVVWCIGGTIGLVSIVSRKADAIISIFFAFTGRWVGRILTITFLTPVYLTIFTAIRVKNRLTCNDPLHIRDNNRKTFWLECDTDKRKKHHIRSMFATERTTERNHSLLVVCFLLMVTAIGIELLLRILGFGNPIVYVDDPLAGFFPMPNQCVSRYGGKEVSINKFGMRSPDLALDKPDDVLRILMIGDSTLYGGSYIDQDNIYSQKLQVLLSKEVAGNNRKVEVLNIGVNAWGPFHKLGYIEKFGTFQADIAFICMPIGDVYRPLCGLAKLPFFSASKPPRFAFEEILGHMLWRYRSRLIGKPTDQWHQDQAKLGFKAYQQLAMNLREAGCEVFIEVLPGKAGGMSDSASPKNKKLMSEFLPVLESSGFSVGYPIGFAKGKGNADDIYSDGVHLHRQGHELYADYMRKRILEGSEKFKAWNDRQP